MASNALTIRTHVRRFALDYAHRSGRKQFTRTSDQFHIELEAAVRDWIRGYVDRCPSIGKTLKQ